MVGVLKVYVPKNEISNEIMKLINSSKYNVIKIYKPESRKHREHGLSDEYILIIAHR